jgi:hypothetical protein
MSMTMQKIRRSISIPAILASSVIAKVAFAQCAPGSLFNPLDPNCSGGVTFVTIAGYFNTFLLAVAAPICGIMVIWGGFQMMTAAGNAQKFTEGRKTLTYAAIGLVIVTLSSGVAYVLQNALNGS